MSTLTVSMAAPITHPPLRPLPWGLLIDAVDMIPESTRWLAGITFATIGCDGPLVMDSDVCADEEILADEPARDIVSFNPFYAFWNMECSTIGGDYPDMIARLSERAWAQLSAALTSQLVDSVNPDNPSLSKGDDVGGGGPVPAALAAVEGELALRLNGAQGIIYIPPSAIGMATGSPLFERQGKTLYTATGHRLVVDAGLEGDSTITEGFIYGSGPVVAAVGTPVEVSDGASNLDRATNTLLAQVRAPAVLAFDPCTAVHADYDVGELMVCTPYITPDDLIGVCELDEERALVLIDEASEVMYRLFGMAFPGECQATVRPCRDDDCWNVGCYGGCDPDWITLPYDLIAVSAVAIDGSVLSPRDYVVRRNQIARSDGQAWPSAQNILAPATAPGTFAITFTHGALPPQPVIEATIAYVAERWKGESADPSTKLPRTVTGVSRQGINLTVNDRVDQVRRAGPTMAPVATAMSIYNPDNVRLPADILNDDTGWTLHVDDTPLLTRVAEDEVAVGPTFIDWNET